MERQVGTGKERKKGLEQFHDALALPHARTQVKFIPKVDHTRKVIKVDLKSAKA